MDGQGDSYIPPQTLLAGGIIKVDLQYNLMVFNATFNNISAISWQSVLLVEETGVGTQRKHRPATQVIDKLYHIMFYRV